MEDLFHGFWWLLFPLGFALIGAWRGWLQYRARRDAMDLLSTYASNGWEPPPELLARLRDTAN
ncbi:hypothetical protein CSW58_12280 [Caulobacter sp. B11]|uniref:hypothetical protein n=1 Tax=Caulobacter sp. B11 TaxID=2048899 RepID=UPI000C12DD28|nr:hypothetical protein [Caulobacter sp. B11]PHY12483.1 hypothetical protein CSW58_12280 [Caulobacter sp. B11]